MKNRLIERRRQLAKQYHRTRRGDAFKDGILVQYQYTDIEPDALSWWDDVQFVLGNVRIQVAWQHPRHAYRALISDAAMEACEHLYSEIDGGLFSWAKPNFKKLGRSRKKVATYSTEWSPAERIWLDAVSAEEARLSRDGDFTVEPSLKVELLAHCRFVSIVAPIEVRNVDELRGLANLVRSILVGATTLGREFPGYRYMRADRIAEGLADRGVAKAQPV